MSDYGTGETLPLFDNPQVTKPSVSRQVSRTSKRESFAEFASKKATQEHQVLSAIQAAGKSGLTRNEIADLLGIPVSSACGRVNALLELDKPPVFQDGTKRSKRAVVFAKGFC